MRSGVNYPRHSTRSYYRLLKMADLPAPVRVSPLIKFGRWSLLTAGILYGLARQSRLSNKEAGIRKIEAKKKVERDAKLAAEKIRMNKAEMDYLAAQAGMPPA